MKRNLKKKNEYKSMTEFEEEFLPNDFKERLPEMHIYDSDFGVSLAKESLNMIKRQIQNNKTSLGNR